MSATTGTTRDARRTGRFGPRLRAVLSALALAVVVLGLGGPAGGAGTAAAATTGATVCQSTGQGTTCTGTFSGDTAWDWYANGGNGGMTGAAPSVTVDQTSGLTNQIVHLTWANFTPSMTIDNVPGYRQGQEFYGVGVFQCKGANPTDLVADCNDLMLGTPTTGATPTGIESYTLSGTTTQPTDCSDVPTDTVCGTGYTDMQVQTAVQNSALGCDEAHPCSLVVLPFWGGNQFTQPATCEDHSLDLGNGGYAGDDGNNPWYSPCAWADRITIPLSFAPTPAQLCGSNDYAFSAQGSPMLERVMGQWEPGWCTGALGSSKVTFNYDSTVNEYEARAGFLGSGGSGLSSSTDVALVTDPPSSGQTAGSSRQFTYAPIETTAITIAYYVDNQVTQEPITNLKLDARLVAKLLTESYSLQFSHCGSGQTKQSDTCDPNVQGNPVSIFTDPEFYALNPEYTEADFATQNNAQGNYGDFLPVVIAGNSDLTYELTRWVYSDPTARSFLEGEPDQWGMHVNPTYEQGRSQSYPATQFQVLDPGYAPTKADLLKDTSPNPYLGTMQVAWNPVTGLDNVAADLANWVPSGDQFPPSCSSNPLIQWSSCPGNLINAKDGADQFPLRALFAVMDSGTAASYRFPMAQLVVDKAGDAVAPTTDSMSAAVDAMKTNPDHITQYDSYPTTSADAYPLTEVQYAMVPTCGLTAKKAGAISTFLNDVANAQTYGVGIGQIPPFGGYLALNDAQKAQDQAAAQAVQRQTCASSPPDTTVGGQTTTGGSGSGTGNTSSNTGGGTGLGTNSTSPATSGAIPTGKASGTASASASATPIGLGDKAADTSSDVKYILPAALAAGALLAIGGPLAYGYGTGGLRLPKPPRFGRGGTHGPGGGSEGSDG